MDFSATFSPLETCSCEEKGNYSFLLYLPPLRGKNEKQIGLAVLGMSQMYHEQQPAVIQLYDMLPASSGKAGEDAFWGGFFDIHMYVHAW